MSEKKIEGSASNDGLTEKAPVFDWELSDKDVDELAMKGKEDKVVSNNKNMSSKADVIPNDASERAAVATESVEPNATDSGDMIMRDAAGRMTGTRDAEGVITPSTESEAPQHMYRDTDGNLRWDNGKLAGPRQTPKGKSMAEKQTQMDKNTEALLQKLRQNNPDHLSDEALLTNYAMRHNAKVVRPNDETNVGPRVAVVGGGDPHQRFIDRRRNFIANNPNAVSSGERAKYLGGGTDWGAIANPTGATQGVSTANPAVSRELAAYGKKQQNLYGRQVALGNAISGIMGLVNKQLQAPINLNDTALRESGQLYTDKQGNHFLRVKLSDEGIGDLNDQWRANGGTSRIGDLMVSVRLDSNGNALRDKSGRLIDPQVSMRKYADGQTGSNAVGKLTTWKLGDIEAKLRDAYKATTPNAKTDEADAYTYNALGGHGTIGRAAAENAEVARNALDRKNDYSDKYRADIVGKMLANPQYAMMAEQDPAKFEQVLGNILKASGFSGGGGTPVHAPAPTATSIIDAVKKRKGQVQTTSKSNPAVKTDQTPAPTSKSKGSTTEKTGQNNNNVDQKEKRTYEEDKNRKIELRKMVENMRKAATSAYGSYDGANRQYFEMFVRKHLIDDFGMSKEEADAYIDEIAERDAAHKKVEQMLRGTPKKPVAPTGDFSEYRNMVPSDREDREAKEAAHKKVEQMLRGTPKKPVAPTGDFGEYKNMVPSDREDREAKEAADVDNERKRREKAKATLSAEISKIVSGNHPKAQLTSKYEDRRKYIGRK